MSEQPPMTQAMNISQVKNQISSVVNRVYRKETRVLIEKSGIPVAALVSPDDLNKLQQLDREWEQTTQAIQRFSQAFADIPVDELEAKIDEIIADNRTKETAARRSA